MIMDRGLMRAFVNRRSGLYVLWQRRDARGVRWSALYGQSATKQPSTVDVEELACHK
jgi:hypothetical protein